jgi:hypothetical protein
MSQFEQRGNVKLCQKLGKSSGDTFRTMKQSNDEGALSCSTVFKRHKRSAQRGESLDMMCVPIGQEQSELSSGSKEISTLVRAIRSQTVDDVTTASAWIGRGNCHRIMSDDLNMSRVT